MSSIKAVISKRTVDALKAPALGEPEVRLWDTKLSGFFVRIRPSTNPEQAKWVLTIGTHGAPWTPEKAREKAAMALGAIAENQDPSAQKQAARRSSTFRR